MKFPRKILMTTDTIGGIWTYTLELCRFFEKQNIEVALVVTGEVTSVSQRKEITVLKNVILYEKPYKLEWMDEPWEDIDKAGEWLLEIEKDFQPDIIHLNSYSFGSLHWHAPVLVVGHSCKLSWWKSVKHGPPPQEWSEYFMRVYNGLHAADFITAPSRFMMHMLNIIYGEFLNQTVIYKGRDKHLFNVPAQKSNLIVSAGKIWDEAKNIRSVVDAAPLLKWNLVIAGSSSSSINIEQTKNSNICFRGQLSLEETAQLFSGASIFVLPAKYEPFGLTPLEAALSGCALVLGKTPSLIEIWEESALYVTSGDIDELAFVVNYLIDNPELMRSYGIKSYNRAQQFSSLKMGENYLALYRRMKKSSLHRHKRAV